MTVLRAVALISGSRFEATLGICSMWPFHEAPFIYPGSAIWPSDGRTAQLSAEVQW